MGCLSIVTDIISRKDCNDCDFNNYNVIEIENFNQETTNFDIDMDKKIKIISIGKKSAKKFIEIGGIKPKKDLPQYINASTQTSETLETIKTPETIETIEPIQTI